MFSDFIRNERGYATVEISVIMFSFMVLILMVFNASFLVMNSEIKKSEEMIGESVDACDIEKEIKALRRWQFIEQSL